MTQDTEVAVGAHVAIGAVSRRVVEEAARLKVPQIVASRRQVDIDGGYTGMDQRELVRVVKKMSHMTSVIRDHGGPNRGAMPDDGIESLDADVAAGFHGLHLDVCDVEYSRQLETLRTLVARYADETMWLEVGGEHDTQDWNIRLLRAATNVTANIDTVVLGAGTFVFNDRQVGMTDPGALFDLVTAARAVLPDVMTKLHNADWLGYAARRQIAEQVDFVNVAPEIAQVEVDALLLVLGRQDAHDLMRFAYDSGAWRRWFHDDQGTWFERARCAVRYVMTDDRWRLDGSAPGLSTDDDAWVRRCIREHIIAL